MTGIDKDIFNATRTLTTLLNDACNHWNYLRPYLENLARAADKALEGYEHDYPFEVNELIYGKNNPKKAEEAKAKKGEAK